MTELEVLLEISKTLSNMETGMHFINAGIGLCAGILIFRR